MYHTHSSKLKACLLLTQCIYVFHTILCTANSLTDVKGYVKLLFCILQTLCYFTQ